MRRSATSYAQYAGLDDPVIEINLTPNRPDCAGVHGIARDLAAADMGKFKDTAIKPVKGEFPCPVAVQIAAPRAVPGVCAAPRARRQERAVAGLAAEAADRDRACARSMRWSISPISSPTTAAGRCTCSTPRKCAAISRCAARKTARQLLALDGKTYTLDDSVCVIADQDGVELLAGIMGGEKTGCSETTTDVLIESALWNEINIAQTGRKLGINSDARYRFERGVDPAFMLPGLELATRMVLDLCGGTPSEVTRRRQRRAARAHHRFPAVRAQAPRRPHRAAAGDAPRARPSRLLRRRPKRAGEDRGAVVAARRRGQGRHRRRSGAHRRRRPRAVDAVRSRRSAAQAGAHARSNCACARPSARSPRAIWSKR